MIKPHIRITEQVTTNKLFNKEISDVNAISEVGDNLIKDTVFWKILIKYGILNKQISNKEKIFKIMDTYLIETHSENVKNSLDEKYKFNQFKNPNFAPDSNMNKLMEEFCSDLTSTSPKFEDSKFYKNNLNEKFVILPLIEKCRTGQLKDKMFNEVRRFYDDVPDEDMGYIRRQFNKLKEKGVKFPHPPDLQSGVNIIKAMKHDKEEEEEITSFLINFLWMPTSNKFQLIVNKKLEDDWVIENIPSLYDELTKVKIKKNETLFEFNFLENLALSIDLGGDNSFENKAELKTLDLKLNFSDDIQFIDNFESNDSNQEDISPEKIEKLKKINKIKFFDDETITNKPIIFLECEQAIEQFAHIVDTDARISLIFSNNVSFYLMSTLCNAFHTYGLYTYEELQKLPSIQILNIYNQGNIPSIKGHYGISSNYSCIANIVKLINRLQSRSHNYCLPALINFPKRINIGIFIVEYITRNVSFYGNI